MESDPADARTTLAALAGDRDALAERISPPWWVYPLLGLAVGLMIGSAIGIGSPLQLSMSAIGAALVAVAAALQQRATGVVMNRPAGPRGLALLVAMAGVNVVLLLVAALLANMVQPAWSLVPAAAGLAVMIVGGRLYDRVNATELRRAR